MSLPIANLYRGSNRLIELQLLQADGATALLASSLTYARVRLFQGDNLVATYVRGADDQLRDDPDATDQLLLELTEALTAALSRNEPLTALVALRVADTDFVVDDEEFKDEIELTLARNVR